MTLRTTLHRFAITGALFGAAAAGCDSATDDAAGPATSGTGPEEVAPVLVPAGTVEGTAESSSGRDPAATPEQPNPPVVPKDETAAGADAASGDAKGSGDVVP